MRDGIFHSRSRGDHLIHRDALTYRKKLLRLTVSLNHRVTIQVFRECLMDSRINSGNDLEKYRFPTGSEVRATPRVVRYSCISHGRRASMRVAPRARALSRDMRFRPREAAGTLQNSKLPRQRHETLRERNLIKFQRSILSAQLSAPRESSSFPKISIFFAVFNFEKILMETLARSLITGNYLKSIIKKSCITIFNEERFLMNRNLHRCERNERR